MDKIYAKEIEFKNTGGDAGMIYNIICPECKETIKVAEYSWWDTECECGYTWELEITGVGKKLKRMKTNKRRMNWLEEIIHIRNYTIGCEVGLGIGKTTSYLLKNCPKLNMIGVDDFKPAEDRKPGVLPMLNRKVYVYPYRPIFDKAVACYKDRLTLLVGTSWEMAEKVEDGSLDFVFIDAGHDLDPTLNSAIITIILFLF